MDDAAPPRSRRSRRIAGALAGILVLASIAVAGGQHATTAAPRNDVRILVSEPTTFDPAAQDDAQSAAINAQVWETLTVFDADLALRPALAASWDVTEGGKRVTFHLRSNLAFSDGTPLTAQDVVGSWLRVIDPRHPSHLSTLIRDIHGVPEYITGQSTDPASVGVKAQGNDVVVDLDRPHADFPAIAATPLLGVVPPSAWRDDAGVFGPGAVVSGGYTIATASDTEITLKANDHYWAGRPAIGTVHLVLDIGGRNPIQAFSSNDLDFTPVSGIDAPWLPYDPSLGPLLRHFGDLDTNYLGFDTRKPPFNDLRVRQAFGAAVDWARVTALAASPVDVPADSMVPAGIPGRSDTSWLPAHDPERARQLLADAGYPGGRGFPDVSFAAGFSQYGGGIAADLEKELGVKVHLVSVADLYQRLTTEDSPGMWVVGWIADYPGANDFLGVLLGSEASSNYGGWSTPTFDEAIAEALSATDPTEAQAAFDRAQAELQKDVPVVPLSYSSTYALSRAGLLGAGQNGLGLLRMAGMSWAP